MKTENVSTLKIHKLSQEQYDRELAAGTLDDTAIYMTPGEEIDLSPYATITQLNTKANTSHTHDASNITSGKFSTARLPVIPIEYGGTGASTVASARKYLGLGNTDGALPIANGGTGSYSVAGARANLGLGATDGALPVANGGTGATSPLQARNNLGITAANIGAAGVSHNHDDRYIRKYDLNSLNIDLNDGNWTIDISEPGHGTLPTINGNQINWINVTQTTSGHFLVQTAIRCIGSTDSSRRTNMFIRDKYNGKDPVTGKDCVWSTWTQIV